MREPLLILTFGLGIILHAVLLTQCETTSPKEITLPKNISFRRHAQPSAFVPSKQTDVLTKARIEDLAQKMGVASFREFSASQSSEETGRNNQASNEYFSIRKQRATQLNREETSSSTEYQVYHGVMGKPGRDFPVLTSIPKTKFSCRRLKSGYYADLDTDCQVFHICDNGRKISFLCPNGTIFRQSDQICDWWFKVECQNTASREQLTHQQNERPNRRNEQVNLRPASTNDEEIVSFEASTYQKQRFNQNVPTTDSSLRYTNAHHQSRNLVFSSTTSTVTPASFVEVTTPVTRTNPPTYKQVRNYRTRVSKPKHKVVTQNESQVVSETASFAGNSNKRFYNFVNPTTTTTTTTTMIPSTTSSTTTEFSKVSEKNNTKSRLKYSRRPYHARYSSKRLHNAFTKNSSSSEDYSYKFNESFAQFTASYNKVPSTTPVSSTENGHFITFSYTTIVPIDDNNDYRNSRFLPSDSVQNSVSISAGETTTSYVTPKIDTQYSRVTKTYLGDEKLVQPTTESMDYPGNFSDPTIYSPEDPQVTTTEKVKYSTSVTKYSPTVPTITPKTPVKETSSTQATLLPEDNAIRMLHTLDEIEENDKFSEPRPGLKIPPSSSPDTLHSLAVYFAAASSSTTTEAPTPLLSKSTLDQYNQLFNIDERHGNTLDLELQQSQGLVQTGNEENNNTVTGSNIRKLARVFTHALSEYLKDPETFRRVLVEIRPKEPNEEVILSTTTEDNSYSTTTMFTDHPSITKEEGEVLDFSDVVKTTPASPKSYPRTTESVLSTTDEDINPLAVQLNNEFNIINNIYNESPENLTSDEDYYPLNYQDTPKTTPTPYGVENQTPSKPLNSEEYNQTKFYIPDDLNNLAVIRVNDQLTPPYNRIEDNEEKLQRAYSGSFLERSGKSQKDGNDIEDENIFKIIVTTESTTTTTDEVSSTTESYTSTQSPTTTEISTTELSTTEFLGGIPENHWSNSLEISRFLQAAVTLDPEVINQELYTSTHYESDTTTQSTIPDYITTTTNKPDVKETITLSETNNEKYLRNGKSYIRSDNNDIIGEQFVLNLPLIPEPLQMKSAKMMFGNLNETSQDIIMEKMKVADKNKSVRKLILLLINTCDLNHNRTLEHARKAILNALISVPVEDDYEEETQDVDLDNYSISRTPVSSSTAEPSTSSAPTTELPEEVPTTYKTVDFVSNRSGKRIDLNTEENGFNFDSRKTYEESSTTEESVGFNERRLELLPPTEHNADKRALELLRSLYSLASRWARK